MSLFRCLAVHHGQKSNIETSTRIYYNQWCGYVEEKKGLTLPPRKDYLGFDFNENLHYFEKCFHLNVNLFSLKEDETALPIHHSLTRYQETMNLNLFEHHASYITNMKSTQINICVASVKNCFRALTSAPAMRKLVKIKPISNILVDFIK